MFNAPKGTKIETKILILIQNYWGKGLTIDEAWKEVKKASCRNLRELKSASHLIYVSFNVIENEGTTDEEILYTSVTEMGGLQYHKEYPPILIHQHHGK